MTASILIQDASCNANDWAQKQEVSVSKPTGSHVSASGFERASGNWEAAPSLRPHNITGQGLRCAVGVLYDHGMRHTDLRTGQSL